MLSLAITFTAGRYHATPWDRHVNEGAVSWPPEPLRLIRAMLATWHHKLKHAGRHDEATLRALIEGLAQELPHYTLPPASQSHTRHYMPQRHRGETSLVFDAFAAVDREKPMYVTWPTLEVSREQAQLLDDVLSVMGYLGRAESWVEVSRATTAEYANCTPGSEVVDPETGEVRGELITLFAPLSAAEYQELRASFLTDRDVAKDLGKTLPETLLDALALDTSALRKHGWMQHPATRKVSYVRPLDALRPRRAARKEEPQRFTTARYLILARRREGGRHANPLPRVEDSLRIAELLRSAVMSRAGKELGANAVPPTLSGHDLPEGNRHQHAFYLPFDANGDGRIDRLVVHVPAGMGIAERRILEKIDCIWNPGGGEWTLLLESIGTSTVAGPLSREVAEWQSVTPYLHPWHLKKSFSVEDQIRRECRERGLPEPIALERLESVLVGSGKVLRRPIHFRRFRSKRGLSQPDRLGSFWKLSFPKPVSGPLALGFGCHFGLGLFAPAAMNRPETGHH